MKLGYVVLSARDLLATKAFYEVLGAVFVEEQHAKGPVHYAVTFLDGTVVEIYPLRKPAEQGFAEPRRMGWVVLDREDVFARLAQAGYMPSRSLGGAYEVRDPDGRVVELLENVS